MPTAEAAHPTVPGSSTDGNAAGEVLRRTAELTDKALRGVFDRLSGSARTVVGFHLGLADEAGRLLATAPEPDVCAALALTCAQASGKAVADATGPATAIALIHHHLQLHGDAMDGRLSRSGRPAAWMVFGRSQAVIAGDALLVVALELLAGQPGQTPLISDFTASLLSMITSDDPDPSCTSGHPAARTAALFSGACAVGATWAGARPVQVDLLRRYGRHLGLATRFADDLATLKETVEQHRARPGGAAPVSRRLMLIAAALAGYNQQGRRLAELHALPGPLTATENAEAARHLEAPTIRHKLARTVAQQHRLALECLTLTTLRPGASDALRSLAGLAMDHVRG